MKSPRAASITGAIQGIAESPQGEGRITILSTRSDLLTVSIITDTQLTRQGQLVGEAELAVGQRVVNGTYDPISGEAFTLMLEPSRTQRLRGGITAIDEERMAVTITPLQGDPVELLVLESAPARITLRGRPSPRFSDLRVGDHVRVALYDPDTFQAYRLVVT